jgi:nucleoside-diphosphate-sugar epimerase
MKALPAFGKGGQSSDFFYNDGRSFSGSLSCVSGYNKSCLGYIPSRLSPDLCTSKPTINMKIFVTGASGFVGTAVVQELIRSGHEVLGLARSEAAAHQLQQAGAAVHIGDLAQPATLLAAVEEADAVIHIGFIHDFTRFAEMCQLDAQVIETIGDALVGTDKPFLVTSAIGVIAQQGIITENDVASDGPTPRVATEKAADAVAAKGVGVAVIRLPLVVHDAGDQNGFVPALIRIAQAKGTSAYIGEGTNLWPAVHRQDAALLYRLVLENNQKVGARYHAVAENGIPFQLIAQTIALRLDIPAVSITKEETAAHFGWFAHFAQFDRHASGELTQQILSWQPQHPTLMEDLAGTLYFPQS